MALPTVKKNWSFVHNSFAGGGNEEDTAKNGLFAIKQTLVSLGWAVVASCNGVSYKNIGDASPDLWASVSDVVIANTFPHSWVILKHSATPLYLFLEAWRGNSGFASYHQHRVRVQYGTIGSDGDVTALPSGIETDAVAVSGAHQVTGPNASTVGCTVSGMAAPDGDTRLFVTYQNGGSIGSFSMIVCVLGNYPGALISAPIWSPNYVVAQMGPSATSYLQSPSFSDVGSASLYHRCVYDEGSGRTALTVSAVANCYPPISGNAYSQQADTQEWQSAAICQGVSLYDATKGFVGQADDIWLAPRNHQSISVYPIDGSRQFVKFGCLMLPWDGTDLGGTSEDVFSDIVSVGGGGGQNIRDIPKLVRSVP